MSHLRHHFLNYFAPNSRPPDAVANDTLPLLSPWPARGSLTLAGRDSSVGVEVPLDPGPHAVIAKLENRRSAQLLDWAAACGCSVAEHRDPPAGDDDGVAAEGLPAAAQTHWAICSRPAYSGHASQRHFARLAGQMTQRHLRQSLPRNH
jgi:hypothetical protein